VPHAVIGPIQKGSSDCTIEGQKAARVTDTGMHDQAVCCGPNTYKIMKGSSSVYINDLNAARKGDQTMHCEVAVGAIIKGAGTVTIGG